MYSLYPAIKPYQRHEFAVSAPHVLYIEEVGNPKGKPVVVLHTGPGAGGDSYLRRFFDPDLYRIILFDQRGCGRSTPHAELKHNTTQDLVEDIEAIREYLGISRFVLFGGGWGSLLALVYAQTYPMHVAALLLHQIFLGRRRDIDWFYKSGANVIFPDYWQDFISIVPPEEQHHICKYYANCLQGNNELARMAAAKHWALWQARCGSLHPHLSVIDQFSSPHFALALAKLESHYINHHFFLSDNQIINNVHKIRHIPSFLIHGRYDMICPLAGAWDLHQVLSASSLRIVRDAGHSAREAGIIDALIAASREIARQDLDVC
ncbi:prolyl aminopeptidase [Legionella jordanis]|uniref:Proline iminopeptidase n=1 Tax=Legionella jordanis TaxID=456 RepID=A0A0W0V979_9GAMM|nr:prolyl aminopeptidase [Legionella jordanis]KTD16691.1 proline iminopeptidase [Legionella jordanis]RMX03777.1 prolyl aminopeptidase [Legionella jordanis]RMX22162.1 prolyl aminopeptidase [Legionella jordanis]VEH11841.1 proline iminopeptidase [Legionella jordanis]HAT8712850.1 prolyl aminopeptidase [Legionella jordanis]